VEATGILISAESIEKAVLVHEFGHLLNLVSDASHMGSTDPNNPQYHHCDDENCVMYYGIETRGFFQALKGGPPTDFCERCLSEIGSYK
jgi:hypothetical protein